MCLSCVPAQLSFLVVTSFALLLILFVLTVWVLAFSVSTGPCYFMAMSVSKRPCLHVAFSFCVFLFWYCILLIITLYFGFLVCTWSVRKVSDLWPGKRNWLTWSVGHLITLKVVPLGLHTLVPAVPPLLEACRKSLFRNGV